MINDVLYKIAFLIIIAMFTWRPIKCFTDISKIRRSVSSIFKPIFLLIFNTQNSTLLKYRVLKLFLIKNIDASLLLGFYWFTLLVWKLNTFDKHILHQKYFVIIIILFCYEDPLTEDMFFEMTKRLIIQFLLSYKSKIT